MSWREKIFRRNQTFESQSSTSSVGVLQLVSFDRVVGDVLEYIALKGFGALHISVDGKDHYQPWPKCWNKFEVHGKLRFG